eukprot:m.220831 g.220831  ORF g.220831 m.220831 type:complete len:51 (+) comp15921_c0_seq21:1779-1931(+)
MDERIESICFQTWRHLVTQSSSWHWPPEPLRQGTQSSPSTCLFHYLMYTA